MKVGSSACQSVLQLEGASGVLACLGCPHLEDSSPGSLECWPGIVSVVASNPPPVVPGLSGGDVVNVTFTKAVRLAGASVNGMQPAFLRVSC
jgi:hypothetical protein